jgi:site-specific recombinase XerD
MESAEHPYTSTLALDELVGRALKELERLKYSRRSVRRYRSAWYRFVAFARTAGLGENYSDELGGRFIMAMRLKRGERANPDEGWRRHVQFLVRVLATFARDGHVERSKIDLRQICIPQSMRKTLSDHEHYAQTRRLLRPSSLRAEMCTLSVFTCYLESRGVAKLNDIRAEDITSFVISRTHLGPRATSTTLSSVRALLRFLLLRGILQTDLTTALPAIRVPRDSKIPSVWEPELLEKLLRAVDRSSPVGKRDYAILLLASRLGMRLGDIQALRLDDLKWDKATIEFIQSKNRAPLCLPMIEDVGVALIDYLKFGRPQTTYREVFLRHRLSVQPFADGSHLYFIVSRWRELAGIHFRSKQHSGLHSLRHSLATPAALARMSPVLLGELSPCELHDL